MNLKELKEQYMAQVKELVDKYIEKIDKEMILDYRELEERGKIIIREESITPNSFKFPLSKKRDIINKLKEHYNKDWDVETILPKNKYLSISFTLKNHIEQSSITKEETDRFGILDIR